MNTNENMTDTPETDKQISRTEWKDGNITENHAVGKEFARKLERERNEAMKAIEAASQIIYNYYMESDEAYPKAWEWLNKWDNPT